MLPECPFLDLQPHRKTFGLIGICHCPSTPDIVEALQSMEERMEEAAQRKGTTVWRCFAFDISDHQLTELHSKRGKPSGVQHLVPIVPNRMLDNGHSLLTIQIQSALNNLCGDIFMSLENSVASALDGTLQPPPRLQTAYDAKTMEKMKNKNRWTKRLEHRRKLWLASHAMLAGAPLNSASWLESTISSMSVDKPRDAMWLGAVHEAMAASIHLQNLDQALSEVDNDDDFPGIMPPMGYVSTARVPCDRDVVGHCVRAIACYQSVGRDLWELKVSATLTLARYYAQSMPPMKKEASRILRTLFETKEASNNAGGESVLFTISSRASLSLHAAMVYESIGMRRKCGFYLHQAAMHYAQSEEWSVAYSLEQLVARAYGGGEATTKMMLLPMMEEEVVAVVAVEVDVEEGEEEERVREEGKLEEEKYDRSESKLEAPPGGTSGTSGTAEAAGAAGAILNDAKGWPVIQRQCHVERMTMSHKLNHHDIAALSAIEALRCTILLNDPAQCVVAASRMTSLARSPKRAKKTQQQQQTTNNHLCLPEDSRSAQEILIRELLLITQGPMPHITIDMTGIPEISSVKLLRPTDEARRHYKRERSSSGISSRREYRLGEDIDGENKHQFSKIFYDPFAKNRGTNSGGAGGSSSSERTRVEWVEGETGEVMVVVKNPLSVALDIQSISVIVQGVPYESYSQSFLLPPLARHVVMLSVKPLASGVLTVAGCSIRALNLEWIHSVDGDGLPPLEQQYRRRHSSTSSSSSSSASSSKNSPVTDPVTSTVISSLPILTARDVFSHESPLTTQGKGEQLSTMFSLMEGQVHQHRIYLENVGTVPIHQIEMILRMAATEEESGKGGDDGGDGDVRSKFRDGQTRKKNSKPRVVDVVVFTSDTSNTSSAQAPAVGKERGEGGKKDDDGNDGDDVDEDDDHECHEVFVWDQATLDDLKSHLPLAPGKSCTLSLTVDARRGVPSAQLIVIYAENKEAAHARRLHVPFALTMEPALTMASVDVQMFGHSTPKSLMVMVPPPSAASTVNSTTVKEEWSLAASHHHHLAAEEVTDTPLALVVLEVENPTPHPFDVTCRVRGPAAGSPPSPLASAARSDDTSGQFYESTFVTTFEGNSIQRLVVPVRRETFRHCTNEITCLRALDTLLDIYWKSSHGIVGSISLLGRESKVSLDSRMVRMLLPPLVDLECSVITTCDGTEQAAPPPLVLDATTTTTTTTTTSSSALPPNFLSSSYPSPIPTYQRKRAGSSADVGAAAERIVDADVSSRKQAACDMAISTTTVAVGDTVRVRFAVRNATSRVSTSYHVRIVPYMHRGSRVVLLDDDTWSPLSMDKEEVVTETSDCFVWSGSLCHTVRQLPRNETASHVIECCMFEPGEYKFAVLCVSLDNDEVQQVERCWSMHPAVVTVV